jgi:cell wall-associated NlpC family hydrolase
MGPDYYDCAGLVAAAYRSAGFNMPFSEAYESSHGTSVGINSLKPGDVVAWGSPVHAVSIYIGNDTIVIADGVKYGVRTDSLSGRTSWDTFAGGHRYL